MRILVLGGTGAKGVPLIEILEDQAHEVFVTSRKERCNNKNIQYILGDAHDEVFLRELLIQQYDVIIDFMVYSTIQFNRIYKMFLDSTSHYIF